jgi:hypothetical protein
MEGIVRRHVAAGLAVLAVTAGVGWRLAGRPESSAGLQDISLKQHSEHSNPGPGDTLAGIRIRLMPGDFGYEVRATDHGVPRVDLAAE